MKNVLIFAAVAEAAIGLALLMVPSLVGQQLLGEDRRPTAPPTITGTIDKLTLAIDRSFLTPEDEEKLKEAPKGPVDAR